LRRSTALRAAAACAVACGVAAPLARHRLRLRPPVVFALAWQAPLALAVAAPHTRARDAGVYALQMWAYLAHFQMPADDPERLLGRLRVRYPIAADTALGLGETPTIRLQRALGRKGRVRAPDLALSGVHWLWYFFPHGSLAYVLVLHPSRFGRSAGLVAATFDLGLIVYWAVPTAPPWWAGSEGHMPPVRRIMCEAGERVWGSLWDPLYDSIGGNPFAAMPSLHYATSHAAARVLCGLGPRPAALGWAYVAALGFALIYLGEHYVVDLAAGLALAEGVRLAAPLAEPAISGVARTVQRLEPKAGR
jgi:membrane-associated phospholipid phosphatase